MRALACALAAALGLAGCKSDDKPKEPPPPPSVETAKERASEVAREAEEKTDIAADKARSALDAVKERAKAAGDVAKAAGDVAMDKTADAITDAKVLRDMLVLVDGRIAKAVEDVQGAPSDDARKAAAAALEKLKQEREKLAARLAALRDAAKDAKAP